MAEDMYNKQGSMPYVFGHKNKEQRDVYFRRAKNGSQILCFRKRMTK